MIDTLKLSFVHKLSQVDLTNWTHSKVPNPNGFVGHSYRYAIKTPSGCLLRLTYLPFDYQKNPRLTLEFSLPKLLFGSNLIPVTDITKSMAAANAIFAKLPANLPEDISTGTLTRLDALFDHHNLELIPAYLRYLSTQRYRKIFPIYYLDGSVCFKSSNIRLMFYEKESESGIKRALGTLRQEISIKNPANISRIFGAKYFADLTFPPLISRLKKDLRNVGLDQPVLSKGSQAGIELVKRFGAYAGPYYYALLNLCEIYPIESIATLANQHPRTLDRRIKDIVDSGLAPGLTEFEENLPPLSIDVELVSEKRIKLPQTAFSLLENTRDGNK